MELVASKLQAFITFDTKSICTLQTFVVASLSIADKIENAYFHGCCKKWGTVNYLCRGELVYVEFFIWQLSAEVSYHTVILSDPTWLIL